ncbi:hypothetical protein LDO26_15360 [Luteimonas sp. BDR2-5]|uniref:hypothetical protein n=1 Tax=Proluteimonas luteida TaxID=2878685 RepID=UPI001E322BCA|nr:hypothetical protein [Luteimonas sp. BDR2-5]MCD9029571.1 hypothetical protein [Luteimonas sp. BDR2-5]
MSTEKRLEHLEIVLGFVLNEALPQGSKERADVKRKLDEIIAMKGTHANQENEGLSLVAEAIRIPIV